LPLGFASAPSVGASLTTPPSPSPPTPPTPPPAESCATAEGICAASAGTLEFPPFCVAVSFTNTCRFSVWPPSEAVTVASPPTVPFGVNVPCGAGPDAIDPTSPRSRLHVAFAGLPSSVAWNAMVGVVAPAVTVTTCIADGVTSNTCAPSVAPSRTKSESPIDASSVVVASSPPSSVGAPPPALLPPPHAATVDPSRPSTRSEACTEREDIRRA
jgi:hypothetical protein